MKNLTASKEMFQQLEALKPGQSLRLVNQATKMRYVIMTEDEYQSLITQLGLVATVVENE